MLYCFELDFTIEINTNMHNKKIEQENKMTGLNKNERKEENSFNYYKIDSSFFNIN